MDLAELLIGQIPEAIYFALFMVFAKGLKDKRILFTIIMIFEYLLLTQIIKFNVTFQLAYTFMTFLSLKVLYKEKAQITDIFVFGVASLYLIFVSILSYAIIYYTIRIYIIAAILNRAILIGTLIIVRGRIKKYYERFRYFWNRHRNESVKIRSLTLRNVSIILFNIMFYVINFCMIFFLEYLK